MISYNVGWVGLVVLYHGDNGNVHKGQELNLVRGFGVGTFSTRRQGGHVLVIIGILLTWPFTHQCLCLSRMEKKNNIYYFSDLTEPLALMYYPEERRIKSYTL